MTEDGRELFKGVAWHYARYRIGYPSLLFEKLIEAFQIDKTKRVLDAGCGTGQITIPLAPHVREVVGLDIEAGMLEEAREQAERTRVHNINWVHERAENISSALGSFRLTTMGAAFHWTEQELVLQKIYEITEDGGGIALISNNGCSVWTDAKEHGWKEKRKAVIQKYLGEKRRAGTEFYKEPEKRFEDLLEESPFEEVTRWTHDWTYEWDIPSIIGNLYSTSFASKKLFGNKTEAFEKDLTAELLKLNPAGTFVDSIEVEALFAWKK